MVKNLAACVSVQLAESLAHIRRAEQAATKSPSEEQSSREQHNHPRTQTEQHTQQVRQGERLARYEQIVTLRKQGVKNADIAAQVGMSERTVREWLSRGDIPYTSPRKERARLVDPYKTYLLSRWHQGVRNGAQLEKELKEKGYKGSGRAMYRYLATLEPSASAPAKRGSSSAMKQAERLPNPLLTLSASQATWLFFRCSDDLKKKEQKSLEQLRQASPEIETAYQLVDKFLHMVADAYRRTA